MSMTSARPAFRDPPGTTVVTGATGWLGRALLAGLTDRANPRRRGCIRALVTSSAGAAELADLPGVEPVLGDVRTAAGLDRLFGTLPRRGDVDVIHAAGVIHPSTTSDWIEVNARGTANVARRARACGVRRMVHVSSNSPFGTNPARDDVFRNDEPYDPALGYGRSKMLAELRLLDEVAAGLDAVIVRPPWFYGPHQPARQTAFFTLVRRGRFPVIGDGRQRRSMVYVDDLVDGIVRAELVDCPPGRGWWIADSRPYELNEIVTAVRDALRSAGLDVAGRQRHVPAFVGRIAAVADAALQRRHRYVAELHVLGELGTTIACDISAARRELGYEPSVGLLEGMRRSVAWCLAEGMAL
jgi:nucleoside-diphosphate-sugar epimerase